MSRKKNNNNNYAVRVLADDHVINMGNYKNIK